MEDIKINEDELLDLKMSDDLLRYVCRVIDVAQEVAYRAVNVALIKRNWLIGYRIATEELKDKTRSENYGLSIIKNLSKEYLKSMEMVLVKLICITIICFISCMKTFSTQCVENLVLFFRGLIIDVYY